MQPHENQGKNDASPSPATAASFPPTSVVIPARNAEATIVATLDSVLSQEYPGPVEVIVADGSDTPATSDLVRRLYPAVKLVSNPERTTGFGINAACTAASGEIILRCDAHAVLPPGYMRRAAETLRRTGAANVGGRQQPVGATFFERAVAIAMTTPLGAGGARYRLGGAEGPVDTVFLGAFRRDALDKAGGVDPALVRNQDYELNWRLREQGETVWFDPELVAAYRPAAPCGASPGSTSITADGSGWCCNGIRPRCCPGISPARCCCWVWLSRRLLPWPAPPGRQRWGRSRTSWS